MNTQSVVLECSREKSVDVRTFGVDDTRSGTNAVWTNEVDIDVEPGDRVEVVLGAIHSIGTDSQSVMEITGLAQDTGLTDNQVLFQFIPYVVNNGYNMVVAPYIGVNTPWYGGAWNGTIGSSYEGQEWVIQKCLLQGYPNKPGNNAMNTGEPIYDKTVNGDVGDDVGYNFYFERGDMNYPWGPKAMKSGHWMPPDGSKFVKINRFYKGPFLTKTTTANVRGDGHTAVFSTADEDDFRPEFFEVSVQIDAPKYETPATICNFINLALHRTNDSLDAVNIKPEARNDSADVWAANGPQGPVEKLHTFSGPLMKSFSANGQPATNSYDERTGTYKDENRFWSQICVRDLNKWYGIHYGMRCEIEFNKMPRGSAGGTPNFHCAYPVYYSGTNTMFYTNAEGVNGVGETEAFPFRKFTKSGQDYYFFTGIKDMIIPTNIAYTQENIDRFKNYIFGKNEKYEGNVVDKTDAEKDTFNWYVDLDIHRTADACNTVDGQIPPDENQAPWSPSGATIKTWADFNGDFLDAKYIKYNADAANLAPPKTGQMANYAWKPSMRATNIALDEGDTGMVRNTLRVYSKFDPKWRDRIKLGNYPNYHANPPAHQGDYKFSGVKNLNDSTYPTNDTMAKEAGVACYPVWVQNSQDDTWYQVIAFALQTDHMTRLENNTWRFQNGARATWAFCSGHWALFSPSSMDNPYGLLYNTQLSVQSNNASSTTEGSMLELPFNAPANSNVVKENYINAVMVGCEDPVITFDSTLSRVEFKQLHTARRVGVQEVIYSGTGQVIVSDIGEQVCKFNDSTMPLGRWNKWRELNHSIVGGTSSVAYPEDRMQPAVDTAKFTASSGYSDAVSGVFLNSVYLQGKGNLIQSSLDTRAVEMTETNMTNSLLYKLGFRYKDLFPEFGDITARHKPNYVNSRQTEYRYRSCKPLTTNADLTVADTTFCSIQDDWYIAPLNTTGSGNNKITGAGRGQPTFQLGFGGFEQFMLAVSDSTAIRASKLPTRLDSSIYLVYSDIAMPEYQQSNQKMNIVGIIPRNYSAGDYVYSFGDNSFGNIPIKQRRKLTSIRTEIRTPNGDLAPINEKSTIVYKLIKPYIQPTVAQIEDPPPNPQEQALYQMKKQNKKLNDIVSLLLELFDKKIKSVKDKDD